MPELKHTYDILHKIYAKHRKQHPENSMDSEQMCLMWSTNDPPDIIIDTDPFNDIEEAFDIVIDDEGSLDLYDMTLEEAALRILEIQEAL